MKTQNTIFVHFLTFSVCLFTANCNPLPDEEHSYTYPTLCPDGIPVFNCFADPCMFANCSNPAEAVCRPNYCGGCNTDWFIGDEQVSCIKREDRAPAPTSQDENECPPGVPMVNCFLDPCTSSKCSNPNATCRPNYCGGCNAHWYVGDQRIDCGSEESSPFEESDEEEELPSTQCPPGVPLWHCFRNPCSGATCSIPNAECRPNYCGGCNAEWFVGNRQVTCPPNSQQQN